MNAIENAQVADLVRASRILFRHGVVDAFGHVSARPANGSPGFLMSRSMAPALVGSDDILLLDEAGEAASGETRSLFLERFIHAAIYRVRPDVVAVVHSHSPAVIPYGIVDGVPLAPVFHMAAFIEDGPPVFEIRDHAGPDSDMLIRDAALGEALAKVLGEGAAVLMRGHGSTVVGGSIAEAVFRAVHLETNARIHTDALRHGPVRTLSPGEARAAAAANAGQIHRAWDLWSREVET